MSWIEITGPCAYARITNLKVTDFRSICPIVFGNDKNLLKPLPLPNCVRRWQKFAQATPFAQLCSEMTKIWSGHSLCPIVFENDKNLLKPLPLPNCVRKWQKFAQATPFAQLCSKMTKICSSHSLCPIVFGNDKNLLRPLPLPNCVRKWQKFARGTILKWNEEQSLELFLAWFSVAMAWGALPFWNKSVSTYTSTLLADNWWLMSMLG